MNHKVIGLLLLLFVFFTSFKSDNEAELQRKYDYFFFEGTRLKVQGKHDAAFELFQHALSLRPQAPSALYEIAQYYLYLNQIPLAEETLEKAVKNDPDNYWYSQTLAGLYQQQNKKDKAIELLEAMSKRFPGKQDPIFGLIDIYGRDQDFPNLILLLNRLEDKVGKSEQITMEKFRIYTQMGDEKKAFEEIEGLVKEYPLDMRYLTILGDTYLQSEKDEKAYEIYKKVLATEPNDPLARYSLATYYEKKGETELYDQQIDTLLLNKNTDTEIKMTLMRQIVTRSEQAGGDSLRIIQLFDKIIEQDTDDTQIPMLYAQYLISKKMDQETIPVLEHILNLDPANTAARLTLLGAAIRKNDFEWVIRICEPGIEATPESLEFYFYLGIAYFQKKEYDKSLDIYQKALQQTKPTTRKELVSDFHSMMGDIFHSKNEMQQAYAAYDSALVYNPDNISALNNYAYYLSVERRDLDRAEEMSHKTIKAEPTNSTFLDTYAWILFEKKNFGQARIYIDQALQNGGEESEVIIEHAGDIYYMIGEVEGALKLWQQALEKSPDSKILKKKIKKKKYIAE